MLSTENPPPDLQCPCEISQPKSNSSNIGNDGKASDNSQHQLVADLLKPGLDENCPLPKFSIRDYVFNARGKDVKNNWPFSQKNLQLCLKYGVKDVLPPFQSLDLVRNPSVVKCTNENISYSDVKLDHSVGQKSAVDANISSSGCEEDKVFPSTTTSQSCSDINSVPQVKNPYLELEAECLPGPSKEKPDFAVRASNKAEKNILNPGKKCKLVVKLNNISGPKSVEDLSLNNSVVSETMASKVCPVCKTFSSSSNTTLNAHIDQCLSEESTIKWTTNSKVIKHRIKPRKTRLVVDIYEAALHCTLEDLDRRNGTNWSSNWGFPDPDLKTSAEDDNKTHASVNIEDLNQEGAVYVDSNGTKLRILSKLGDLSSNKNDTYDSGPTKCGNRDKGCKFLSRKKKCAVQKQKNVKSPANGQKSYSLRPQCLPNVNNGLPKNCPPEGHKDDLMQPCMAHDQMKSDGLGMIKPWVGSKRTGLKKVVNLERENQCPCKIRKNLRVKSGAYTFGDTIMKRDSSSKSPISCDENPLLRTESKKGNENLCNSCAGCLEQPCQKNKLGISLQKSQVCDDKRNHLVLSTFDVKQLRKYNPSVHERRMDPPRCTENNIFSRRKKRMADRNIIPSINADSSFISSRCSKPAISSGNKKFSSLRKKLFSVTHTSVPQSKKNLEGEHFSFKNPTLQYTSKSEEDMIVSRSAIYMLDNLVEKVGGNAAQMDKASAKPCINRSRVLKIPKKKGGFANSSKGDMTSNGLEISPECVGLEKDINSLTVGNVTVGMSNALEWDEMICEPTYKVADRDAFVAFGKSLDPAIPGLTYPSDDGYVSRHYTEAYGGHCPAGLALSDEQEMLCAGKVGNDLITTGGHVVVEMDANEAQGNYFVQVDSIPIPGPPGSFLPSPGHTGSEELLGNSSLTTSRIQSPEDEHEVVDMDSSPYSPISAMSAVSNSDAKRSDSISINVPVQSYSVQRETQCDISEDGIEPVDGSSPLEQATTAEREFDPHESKLNLALPAMYTHRFENIQPCYFSGKDEALLGDSLNCRESQLLRRQSLISRPVLAQDNKMADDPRKKVHLSCSISETLPEKEPNPEPGKVAANSANGPAPALVSHHSESKFPNCVDCEFPSPSTLRLMGKNLMVASKGQNLSPQTMPTQSNMVMDHPGRKLCVDNNLSASNYQDEHGSSQGPNIYLNMPCNTRNQHLDFNSSDGFETPANFRPPQSSAHPSTIMFSSTSFAGSFTASKFHEYASLIHDQQGYTIQLDTPATYDIEKVLSTAAHLRTVDSSGGKHKEIIAIDDSPENEAHLAVKVMPSMNMGSGESLSGISAPMGLHCDSRRVDPFCSYLSRGYPLSTGSQMVQNGTTRVPSALYFSPGFS